MGLDQVSGGGQSSILESLRLNNDKKKSEPEVAVSSSAEKYIKIASDVVVSTKVNKDKGSVPHVENSVMKDLIPSVETPFLVGDHVFKDIRKITDGMSLDDVKKITKNNKIDEVFFKTQDGQLYVAYGAKSDKGALNLDQVQEGFVGKFGKQTAKIVHLDNETNTVREGALSPIKSTWSTVKEAGATGVAKGITEMGGTVVAMFVGKSLIQNGITAVNESGKVAEGVSGGVSVIKTGAKIVGDAGKTGKAIASTVGSGIKQVGVGVAIAGVVVGGIAGGMAIYGAISAKNVKNDYSTIDMVTDPYLAFVPKEETAKK